MNISELISNAPIVSEERTGAWLDAMADWFSDVVQWAGIYEKSDIGKNAKDGLFFVDKPQRVVEYRRKILAQLKTIRKEQMFVDDRVKIFIVHGHDDGLKDSVARFLEKQGLEAIILHEQANGGRTIIEKLEQVTADVKYAIVLYTADDEGVNGQKRARQNVIFEHGYFTAKLGRGNVCVIMDNNIEKPSDNQGVLYIPRTTWQTDLVKELRNVGIWVDANLI